jgi:hypothetical protein
MMMSLWHNITFSMEEITLGTYDSYTSVQDMIETRIWKNVENQDIKNFLHCTSFLHYNHYLYPWPLFHSALKETQF